MNRKLKVLIADDHAMFVDGIRRLIEKDYDIVGAVEDGRSLVGAAKTLRPEIVIADVSMPLLNGIDATHQVLECDNRVRVILVTMHADVTFASRAFEVGISGYVLKHSASEELLMALREVAMGRTYITPRIAGDLLQVMRNRDGVLQEAKLTDREREVLQLLAEGKSMKEVATVLNVSTRTVEFHKYNLMDKTGLRTTAELTHYAIKHGLVSP